MIFLLKMFDQRASQLLSGSLCFAALAPDSDIFVKLDLTLGDACFTGDISGDEVRSNIGWVKSGFFNEVFVFCLLENGVELFFS